jgi:hypothetical protein
MKFSFCVTKFVVGVVFVYRERKREKERKRVGLLMLLPLYTHRSSKQHTIKRE